VSPPPHCPGTCLCDNTGVKDEALRPSLLLKSPPQVVHPSLTVPLLPEETDSRITLLVTSVTLTYILAQTIRLTSRCDMDYIYFLLLFLLTCLKPSGPYGASFLYIYIYIYLYFVLLYGVFVIRKRGLSAGGEGVMGHAISITGCLSYFCSCGILT